MNGKIKTTIIDRCPVCNQYHKILILERMVKIPAPDNNSVYFRNNDKFCYCSVTKSEFMTPSQMLQNIQNCQKLITEKCSITCCKKG